MRISGQTIINCTKWFSDYAKSYLNDDEENNKSIILKEKHTYKVCGEILYIAKNIGLSDDEKRFAELTALFHDVGRFEQYKIYRTYVDKKSTDHAALGVKVLKDTGVIYKIEEEAQDLLLRVVSYHNRLELPADETEECLFYTKLVRDADKLDILDIVIGYYINQRKNGEKVQVIEYGLPETPGISDEVRRDVLEDRVVKTEHLRNLNDFRMLQLAWIFGLNFNPSVKRFIERKYIENLYDNLCEPCEIDDIKAAVKGEITNYEFRIRDERKR